jgi:hypothetical protein
LPQWCYDATEPQKDELYELAYLELKTCPAAEGLLREILGYPVIDERIVGDAISTRSMSFSASETSENKEDMLIFPNPSNTSVVINSLRYPDAQIKIMDISGKQIFNTQLNFGAATVSTETWSNGIYFVHLTTSTKSIVKKLVVNH